jgi:hypothetical protein
MNIRPDCDSMAVCCHAAPNGEQHEFQHLCRCCEWALLSLTAVPSASVLSRAWNQSGYKYLYIYTYIHFTHSNGAGTTATVSIFATGFLPTSIPLAPIINVAMFFFPFVSPNPGGGLLQDSRCVSKHTWLSTCLSPESSYFTLVLWPEIWPFRPRDVLGLFSKVSVIRAPRS